MLKAKEEEEEDTGRRGAEPRGSRPPGQGLVREAHVPRVDWSAPLRTGKIVCSHRHKV